LVPLYILDTVDILSIEMEKMYKVDQSLTVKHWQEHLVADG